MIPILKVLSLLGERYIEPKNYSTMWKCSNCIERGCSTGIRVDWLKEILEQILAILLGFWHFVRRRRKRRGFPGESEPSADSLKYEAALWWESSEHELRGHWRSKVPCNTEWTNSQCELYGRVLQTWLSSGVSSNLLKMLIPWPHPRSSGSEPLEERILEGVQ